MLKTCPGIFHPAQGHPSATLPQAGKDILGTVPLCWQGHPGDSPLPTSQVGLCSKPHAAPHAAGRQMDTDPTNQYGERWAPREQPCHHRGSLEVLDLPSPGTPGGAWGEQPLPGLSQFGAGRCRACSPGPVPAAGRGWAMAAGFAETSRSAVQQAGAAGVGVLWPLGAGLASPTRLSGLSKAASPPCDSTQSPWGRRRH